MPVHHPSFARRVAAGLLAMLLLLSSGCASEAPTEAASLCEAVYPEMPPYPNEQAYVNALTGEFDNDGFEEVYSAWREAQRARRDVPAGYADSLKGFFSQSTPMFLSGGNENRACSPLNIYIALAMLAETTGGNSRQQILDALGSAHLDSLRTQAAQVWKAHYCNDGASTCVLANSLWLDSGLTYHPDVLRTLADIYYASAYQGHMGSDEMNRMLQEWLSKQTGGLLEEQIPGVTLDPQTVLALASTIYYRAKWRSAFWEENNTTDIFHAPAGDRQVTYMNTIFTNGSYFWGADFGAARLALEDGSCMWLVLPDEGATPQTILKNGHALDMILNGADACENQKQLIVHLSVPKFDIVSDLQLQPALESLGITDVFQEGCADFSPILPEDPAQLDSVRHAARVAIDEEGITAAAYTVMMMAGAGRPPEDEIYLTFDRPFLFVVASQDNLPLFAGVVNQP